MACSIDSRAALATFALPIIRAERRNNAIQEDWSWNKAGIDAKAREDYFDFLAQALTLQGCVVHGSGVRFAKKGKITDSLDVLWDQMH